MNYSSIKYFSTVNGIGVRTAIFVSGCNLHCKGCFNQIAWDFNSGKEFTDEILEKVLDSIDKKYINGLSILGGEPLDEKNVEYVNYIIEKFRERFGNNKDIWIWSGYYLSEMNDRQIEVAKKCDYLIDGRFNSDFFKQDLYFRGSSNQTIWQNVNGEFIKSELNEK